MGFPHYEDVNITLSLDDELVKKVRKIAVERDTTLTGIVRGYLETLVVEDAARRAGPRQEGAGGRPVVSTQELAEFAATLLHKMAPAARPEDVTAVLDALGPIRVVIPDGDVVRRAVEVRAAYGVHFYDGMIVAAAERGGCGRIWSEDLNAGQEYFGIAVENPFQ